MTDKEFFRKIANGKDDFLQEFVDILKKGKLSFCVIGGLGVNAYAEPVISLDLDVVIVSEKIDSLLPRLKISFRARFGPRWTEPAGRVNGKKIWQTSCG